MRSSTILYLDSTLRKVASITRKSLYLREKAPGTRFVGGYVGPKSGLNTVEKRKNFFLWESNLGRSARSPSL
jgi:hypothetical protein